MSKFKLEIVITRHPALVEYLREIGLADEGTRVLAHAQPADIAGKHVCGVLPHSLSSLAKSFTEIPLTLPQAMRGAELSVEQIRQYAGPATTYIVIKVENENED